jgi:hypothetical protein
MDSLMMAMPTTADTSMLEIGHQFAIEQLYRLHQQFVRFAPSGIMEIRAFEELVQDIDPIVFYSSGHAPWRTDRS